MWYHSIKNDQPSWHISSMKKDQMVDNYLSECAYGGEADLECSSYC